jgi:hypothetical protein
VVALAVSTLSACTGDDGGAMSTPATIDAAAASSSSTSPAPDSTPATVAPQPEPSPASSVVGAAAAPSEWVRHPSGDDCRCTDGSEHAIHTRAGDPSRVLLYFQGGGACVDVISCHPTTGTYKTGTWPGEHPTDDASGIFAIDEPRNPFLGWTHVFVPYCSADFFLGDAVTTYDDPTGATDGQTIEHRGANTLERAVDLVVERYGTLETLVVAGTSAGAVPAPLAAGLASDALPSADIAVLADGAGGYPSDPGLNTFLADIWGTDASIPSWPEFAGVRTDGWGIPDLFAYAGQHDPAIRMARFDNSHDGVQLFFSSIMLDAASEAGHPAQAFEEDLPASLDATEQHVEAAGVALDVYIAPGDDHTVLDKARLYDLVVGGVALVDWIDQLANGSAPGDVR